jgi:hypothetical protein
VGREQGFSPRLGGIDRGQPIVSKLTVSTSFRDLDFGREIGTVIVALEEARWL